MTKLKNPDKQFVYISPLKNCENESARQIARLIEQFLIDNIKLQIEFVACRVEQIYKHADKYIGGEQ